VLLLQVPKQYPPDTSDSLLQEATSLIVLACAAVAENYLACSVQCSAALTASPQQLAAAYHCSFVPVLMFQHLPHLPESLKP
jgi:hypothetical protein